MKEISVDFEKLRNYSLIKSEYKSTCNDMQTRLSSLRNQLDGDIARASHIGENLKALCKTLDRYADTLDAMSTYLQDTADSYGRAELKNLGILGGTDRELQNLLMQQTAADSYDLLSAFGLSSFKDCLPLIQKFGMFGNVINPMAPIGLMAYGVKNFDEISSYVASHTEVNSRSVEFDAYKQSIKDEDGIVTSEINVKVGKAKAGWDLDLGLLERVFNPKSSESNMNLAISAGVSAALAAIDGEGQIGNDNAALYGKFEGELGTADAKGEVKVDLDKGDVNVKGSLKASAFSGEVEGGFKILGFEIGGTLKGDVAAIGVEGEAGFDDGKFKIGGSVAALFGVGFELEIGLAD